MTDTTIARRCESCGAANRIPVEHLADEGRCGKCKAPLPPASEPIEVDTATFDRIVREAPVPVLADFWAAWCGPCRMAAPEIKAVAKEMAGRAVVLKVDIDRHPELADRYRIMGIPYFAVFSNGRMAAHRAGVAPRSEMRRWLEQAAGPAAA